MLEFIQSAGLETSLARDNYAPDETWTTTLPSGFWFGVLLQGRMSTIADRLGQQTWSSQPDEAVCNFWLEAPLAVQHLSLQGGPVTAAFVRIPPETVEATLGEDASEFGQTTRNGMLRRVENRIGLTLAWQMLGCPLEGSARRLYLTGKAMELISAVVQVHTSHAASRQGVADGLKSQDVRRLHEARGILLSDLENPPTVMELAREVGLNSRKLGLGFKALFGSSVYAFIKTQRLERAHLLLQNGDLTVAQVAYACGYQPAHFSTEFRRRFSIPPSALLAGRKRPV